MGNHPGLPGPGDAAGCRSFRSMGRDLESHAGGNGEGPENRVALGATGMPGGIESCSTTGMRYRRNHQRRNTLSVLQHSGILGPRPSPNCHLCFLESVPKALCCGPSPWSLVPKPIPVLRPGQPTEHQLNHADPDLRLAGISQVFIIPAVNPAPTQPAEGSLHHPPPRQQLKPSVPGKPADDLNHIPSVLRDPSVQGVIVVLGVRPQLPQARERFAR